ncbi:hypothetical protein G8E05_10660 [Clostridium botulinum]|uniref:hypothetical protein n=1 Tax=Clostridium botulinum TaxID=1491 RepID=UPI00016BBAF2|nr:hypothetical protein [Clostridium botulinum]AJD28330.1 putative dihydrolipoyllysine-residue acetyltransferase component of pyruvate dehydrogenase complex [Clostridium botulinum CDC_297]EDT86289.1 dihydrolipoyllysine-residue acetyltransferase component of pyruvate dehydrogenase complex [Clostridium botulinum Bf]MBY6878105.1 hypothetical protein [Clostridium botulinum]MBY6881456.1 hypothetical protein [Clostridium botulinum]MBY6892896.1 hypothetical protein [Clostridium botulinum]
MLKSINKLREIIIKGQIKRIFVFDSWNKHFVNIIIKEFDGLNIDICVIKNSLRCVEGISFNNKDCIIFNETILNNYSEVSNYILQQANINNVLIKVFNEDVDNYYKGVETIELPKGERIKTDKGKVTVKIKLDTKEVMKDVRETMRESIKRNIEVII